MSSLSELEQLKLENERLRDALNHLTNSFESELSNGEHFADLHKEAHNIIIPKLIKALELYADKNNWRDLWKDQGHESPDFKYYYRFGHSTNDMEPIQDPGHFYMGKAARQAIAEYKKYKESIE